MISVRSPENEPSISLKVRRLPNNGATVTWFQTLCRHLTKVLPDLGRPKSSGGPSFHRLLEGVRDEAVSPVRFSPSVSRLPNTRCNNGAGPDFSRRRPHSCQLLWSETEKLEAIVRRQSCA